MRRSGRNAHAVRVLIVDDQLIFAEGLKSILTARTRDIEVVGVARDGAEALEMVATTKPHIVLLDVRMPRMDGVETTRRMHERFPEVKILILTTFDDDEYVNYSLSYGAIGYLLKDRPPAELIASIRAVRSGILQIDPGVSRALIHDVHEASRGDGELVRNMNTLTPREREVLRSMLQACANQEIGARMGIAEQTVRNYISVIYSKLQIVNRVEIMKYTERIQFYLDHF
jgi:DNA-binding NarL/FixJ family response regulator